MEHIWCLWKGLGSRKKPSEAAPKLHRATFSQLWDFCAAFWTHTFLGRLFNPFKIWELYHSNPGKREPWIGCWTLGMKLQKWQLCLVSPKHWTFIPWAINILSQEFLTREFLESSMCFSSFLLHTLRQVLDSGCWLRKVFDSTSRAIPVRSADATEYPLISSQSSERKMWASEPHSIASGREKYRRQLSP